MKSDAKPFPHEEPSADLRQAASAVRQVFVSLVQEGFTEQQALVIVGQILAVNAKGGQS